VKSRTVPTEVNERHCRWRGMVELTIKRRPNCVEEGGHSFGSGDGVWFLCGVWIGGSARKGCVGVGGRHDI